jgi:uncharacterized RDD family membrane protein YckC
METPTPPSPHDEPEPTVAFPAVAQPAPVETIAVAPAADVMPVPVVPAAAAAPPSPAYVYGNPFSYLLRRTFALVLDLVVPSVAGGAVFYGPIAINPVTGLPIGNETAFDVTLGIALAAALVYVIVAQAIFGTTLGKLFVGLHVFPQRGRFVGFGRSLVRTLLLFIDVWGIGAVLALLPGHRRLGDLIGGTIVARSPLRTFAPMLGAIGLALVAAAPFLLGAGPENVLATLGAFLAFGPHIAGRAFDVVMALAGMAGSRP